MLIYSRWIFMIWILQCPRSQQKWGWVFGFCRPGSFLFKCFWFCRGRFGVFQKLCLQNLKPQPHQVSFLGYYVGTSLGKRENGTQALSLFYMFTICREKNNAADCMKSRMDSSNLGECQPSVFLGEKNIDILLHTHHQH